MVVRYLEFRSLIITKNRDVPGKSDEHAKNRDVPENSGERFHRHLPYPSNSSISFSAQPRKNSFISSIRRGLSIRGRTDTFSIFFNDWASQKASIPTCLRRAAARRSRNGYNSLPPKKKSTKSFGSWRSNRADILLQAVSRETSKRMPSAGSFSGGSRRHGGSTAKSTRTDSPSGRKIRQSRKVA